MKPRLILLGEPYEIRHKLSKKLSNFFGVKLFTIDDILDKKSHREKGLKNEMRFKLSLLNACHDGFVLCGFPTREKDLECLENIDLCVFFNVDDEKAIKNNIDRRWCTTCFKIYHLKQRPPLHEGRCDRCDSPLDKLPDDDPHTMRNRIFDWYKILNPVISAYKKNKKLLEVKDERDIKKISSKILSILLKESKPLDNIEDGDPTFRL